MGYMKAEEILPVEIIQQYADGINLYIPRKADNCMEWGETTQAKQKYRERNQQIYQKYLDGMNVKDLADEFYLSDKSIWRVIRNMRKVS